MLLFINTTNVDRAEIALVGEKKITKANFEINRDLSEKLLPAIKALLKKTRMSFSDILILEVVTGRGSYTGLRIGASTANALAYSLKIPIFQVDSKAILGKNLARLYLKKAKIGQISPIYGGPPNITKSNRRKY
ncbi:MAG: tRNA (adenosine(37)-N6)-threonylcarbamoyltransferase complex dimerization subunit type 1 TsaB [Candidatus Doudnabacteria bacterium RIFCSPHIGHO2_01_FULL_43_23]|uniref:tRNA (Adenosine(37)-N6)-threonylcarbamoyltransferase complex dimerization subunit type 1 TsaB n=1 Tax=Candidatus Doudnabacteria bacterium RIFCSPHIGHO2_01_FULL_43_23 TaxID=1817822 RepID=A0A1F5NSS0_9BACT|nr:MAG: tRNA (adenosine(37)-N6)-threonylcarbamoyltransferase complex dimerization subunit type 1 TsaB [Candidatus Doudnabacteria bacterium RIFCSPHIGHO2_01_FULL_43_23]